jgi:hypothetical protein
MARAAQRWRASSRWRRPCRVARDARVRASERSRRRRHHGRRQHAGVAGVRPRRRRDARRRWSASRHRARSARRARARARRHRACGGAHRHRVASRARALGGSRSASTAARRRGSRSGCGPYRVDVGAHRAVGRSMPAVARGRRAHATRMPSVVAGAPAADGPMARRAPARVASRPMRPRSRRQRTGRIKEDGYGSSPQHW